MSNRITGLSAPSWIGQAFRSARDQVHRRARIHAVIRQLLSEAGIRNVTLRRIAEESGFAVQTVYNLAGPRHVAIRDAISNMRSQVAAIAAVDVRDPLAIPQIVAVWFEEAAARQELVRQINLIYFSGSRSIYYQHRDRLTAQMRALLMRQKEAGVLLADVNTRELAEQIVMLVCALWIDWSDRGYDLDRLRRSICAAYVRLLESRLDPRHRERVLAAFTQVTG